MNRNYVQTFHGRRPGSLYEAGKSNSSAGRRTLGFGLSSYPSVLALGSTVLLPGPSGRGMPGIIERGSG